MYGTDSAHYRVSYADISITQRMDINFSETIGAFSTQCDNVMVGAVPILSAIICPFLPPTPVYVI